MESSRKGELIGLIRGDEELMSLVSFPILYSENYESDKKERDRVLNLIAARLAKNRSELLGILSVEFTEDVKNPADDKNLQNL
jgi:hypothetical protein